MITFGQNNNSDADVRVTRTAEGTAFEIAIAIINIAMWVMVACIWKHLPEQVATHFDATGTADASGTKWVVPITALVGSFVSALMCFCAYRPARYINMPYELKNQAQYIAVVRMARILGVAISVMDIFIVWGMAGDTFAGSAVARRLTIGAVVVILIIVAWYTARIRRMG